MPEEIITFYFDNESAFYFVGFILGTIILAKLITFLFTKILIRLTAKTETDLDDKFVAIIQKPLYWGVVLGGVYLAILQLPFFEPYLETVQVVAEVLFIVILLMVALQISKVGFTWAIESKKLKKREKSFLWTIQKIINVVIYVIAGMLALQSAGISITPLIASLGIGGLAVGLALQPTLSNYFSGLYVAADGFIQVGDYIELENGMRGTVEKVGIRNTLIRLWNNNLVMVPNSKISDNIITNYNEPGGVTSFIVTCGVAYDTDLKKAEKIALEVAQKVQNVKKYGNPEYEALFRYYNFGDSNIDFKVIMQAKTFSDHYLMTHEFMKKLKTAFDKAGITISFPVRTVEVINKPE